MIKLRPYLYLLFLLTASLQASSLTDQNLLHLIKGNSFVGQYSDSQEAFALYFDPSGKVYIQNSKMKKYSLYGKWEIKGHLLETPWPVYHLRTGSSGKVNFYSQRDLRTFKLEMRPLGNSTYEPYKIRGCSCDPSPEQSFPKCQWVKGKASL
ncbi:MAG: hypothetical protein S4CHLAM7_14650 [Chlamydiae bacterium]|nr:hypothetical protein [Chlamydiota bacterium]